VIKSILTRFFLQGIVKYVIATTKDYDLAAFEERKKVEELHPSFGIRASKVLMLSLLYLTSS